MSLSGLELVCFEDKNVREFPLTAESISMGINEFFQMEDLKDSEEHIGEIDKPFCDVGVVHANAFETLVSIREELHDAKIP